ILPAAVDDVDGARRGDGPSLLDHVGRGAGAVVVVAAVALDDLDGLDVLLVGRRARGIDGGVEEDAAARRRQRAEKREREERRAERVHVQPPGSTAWDSNGRARVKATACQWLVHSSMSAPLETRELPVEVSQGFSRC